MGLEGYVSHGFLSLEGSDRLGARLHRGLILGGLRALLIEGGISNDAALVQLVFA
jgi:hypothetical protein